MGQPRRVDCEQSLPVGKRAVPPSPHETECHGLREGSEHVFSQEMPCFHVRHDVCIAEERALPEDARRTWTAPGVQPVTNEDDAMSTNGDQVGHAPSSTNGLVDSVAVERRGPCPALNALANDGHLPRDGRVTADQLVHAIHERLGVAPSIAKLLAKAAVDNFGKPGENGEIVVDLSDLVQHGIIEHDASLTRLDSRDGNAAPVHGPLLDQLLGLSQDGKTLTLEDLATAHQLRIAQSSAGGHSVPLKASVLGLFEAAVLYQVLRGNSSIALTDAREFLGSERVPATLVPRDIGWGSLLLTSLQLVVMGNSPFSAANRRARELAASPAPVCPVAHGAPAAAAQKR